MKQRRNRGRLVALAVLAVLALPALAWDAVGHRAITWLALDGLADDAPVWLRDPALRHAIAWQAAEPDRWRGVRDVHLIHENAPDHFLDIEDLEKYGLTLDSVPPLRYQYVAAMAVARHVHPDQVPPHNPKLDPAGQQEWPGFLPHAIVEHHAKLLSAFKTYRTLEKLNEPARAPQLEMARRNIAVEMGILSHFVGDAAQPLHTTRHFNGWVGDNPNGFTTDKGFHAYIDGGVIKHHGLTYAALKPTQTFPYTVDAANPWPAVIEHIRRSHDDMRTLYEMERAGTLKEAAGKAMIARRLNDGAAMLAALYNSAWKASEPSERDVKDFIRYDSFDPREVP
ncbi:MAG: hypothetical protein JNJ48_04800 [Phycisphaerae bacterium]|nr:hypothetical protein [Phycisphaerae bacterium]